MKKAESTAMTVEYRPGVDERKALVVSREPGKEEVRTIVEVVPPKQKVTPSKQENTAQIESD